LSNYCKFLVNFDANKRAKTEAREREREREREERERREKIGPRFYQTILSVQHRVGGYKRVLLARAVAESRHVHSALVRSMIAISYEKTSQKMISHT